MSALIQAGIASLNLVSVRWIAGAIKFNPYPANVDNMASPCQC